MKKQIRRLDKALGSPWTFQLTLLLFAAESCWLALTSRFPMAFDEGYHFNLIQFFAHRLNPVVTSQTSDTYRFGALIQNTSTLYHYLMSFPYRIISLFTHDTVIQVIGLRFVNIALAVTSLLVIRKLLRLLRISNPLANVLMLALALTPLMAVLSAQISYDNLFVLAVSLCIYWTVLFLQQLEKGRFNTKTLLILLVLCLFSSLVKFAFLPLMLAITVLVAWKIIRLWRVNAAGLKADAKESFANIGRGAKLSLLIAAALGSFMFIRIYGVNLVRYHNPVPQCDQVLNVKDCADYYVWNRNHMLWEYNRGHQPGQGVLHYSAYWLTSVTFQLFSAQVPLRGNLYAPPPYLLIVTVLGAGMFICAVVNFGALRKDKGLMAAGIVSLIYLFFLWAKNYHDYRQLGEPLAIHGRYVLPILIYIYVFLALGLRQALKDSRLLPGPAIKASLALVIVFSFIYYGGARQYVHYVNPIYGPLSSSNEFILRNAADQ